MKHGDSCTIDKQNASLPNRNRHHHLEAKYFESIGVKERLAGSFFFYGQDIGHYVFIPEGEVVNKYMSVDILCRLGVAVRRKRPKNGDPTFTTMLQHTDQFWSGIS
jgi:hypothetical protein